MLQCSHNVRKIALHCLPNRVQIDVPILVNEDVPHPDHVVPRQSGIGGTSLGRDSPSCLSNDLQAPDHCVLTLNVAQEALLISPRDILQGQLGSFWYV